MRTFFPKSQGNRRPMLCRMKGGRGSRTITFIFAVHPVGERNRGTSGVVDRAEDEWHMLEDPPSVRQQTVAGVGVAAVLVEPILALLWVQRWRNACVTSADWECLCYYSCWITRRA